MPHLRDLRLSLPGGRPLQLPLPAALTAPRHPPCLPRSPRHRAARMSLSKACAALTRRAHDQTRSPSCRLHSALAVCGSSSAPLNLALQAHATAALLLYRHTEEAALSVQQLQAALERCDAAPSHQTLPVVCAGAAVAQGLIQHGELELARCHHARTPHNAARPPPPTHERELTAHPTAAAQAADGAAARLPAAATRPGHWRRLVVGPVPTAVLPRARARAPG